MILAYTLYVYLPSGFFTIALILFVIAVTGWKLFRWSWDQVNPFKWLL